MTLRPQGNLPDTDPSQRTRCICSSDRSCTSRCRIPQLDTAALSYARPPDHHMDLTTCCTYCHTWNSTGSSPSSLKESDQEKSQSYPISVHHKFLPTHITELLMVNGTQRTFDSFLIDHLKTPLSSRHTTPQDAHRRLTDTL